VGEEEATENME